MFGVWSGRENRALRTRAAATSRMAYVTRWIFLILPTRVLSCFSVAKVLLRRLEDALEAVDGGLELFPRVVSQFL